MTASILGPSAQGVVTVPSADVHLKNLGVGPANLPGVVILGPRASATIDGVVIEGAQEFGLLVRAGAHMGGRELSISGTRPNATGSSGLGVVAAGGAVVDLTRVFLSRNHEAAVFVQEEGTSLTLSDVVVEETQGRANDGTGGRGLNVQTGARATVTRAFFVRNRDFGVFVSGDGTSLTLSDVVVEETQGQANDGTGGRGLGVQAGATADVTRALFSENHDVGVSVGDGASLTLSDAVVEDTQGRTSDGTGGRGLNVQRGATAEVTRALFYGNHDIGVLVSSPGTSLTLSDVVVEDTQGQGLAVQFGATAEVSRALFSGNRHIGVLVGPDGTSLTLSDVVVEDTQGQASDGAGGRGLGVQCGATAAVIRALFSGNREVGVFVSNPGTSLTLSDVVVEDTQGQSSDGTAGRGLNVQTGATAEVSRALFSGNREFGIHAVAAGTSVRLSDVVVRQTAEQACVSTTCADRPFGVALGGISQANLVATRFAVQGSALCGVLVMDDGEVDLSLGQVSGSPIGVCLQVDDYAIARLTESVRYVDNETNLDATSLPVPEPVRPVDTTE